MQPVDWTALSLLTVIAALCVPTSEAGEAPQAGTASRIVPGMSRFSLDLYNALREGEGNIFCSPLNIATALEMTAGGARGETASQISRTLHLGQLGDQAHADLGTLLSSLQTTANPDATGKESGGPHDDRQSPGLWTANAVWVDEQEKLVPDFVALLERSYRTKPHLVDFAHSAEAARATINRWVEEQTRDKIKDLLKPEHIRPGTVVVLTSAIYFKGYWTHPFSVQATRDDQFHTRTDNAVPIKMMNQTAQFPYLEAESFQAVALPYKDSTLSMVVLLPKTPDGLRELEASLTTERLDRITAGMKPRRVKLSLPRFTSTVEFELKDVLSKMGMPLAFEPGEADFSGINGARDIYISAVVHKAFIEVEEKGTEAAAATAVVGVRAAMILDKELEFRADHPFLYLIRDDKSGAILFFGRLNRP